MSVVLLLALATGPTMTASFRFEDGFIVTKVMKDARPAGTCLIKVYNGSTSPPLVEGETEDGAGTFPLGGNSGLVGITIDGKECDLIPLSVKDGEVFPPRVLMTFGTRPCCVGAKKPEEPAPPARQLPPLFYLFLGGSVLLGVAALVLMLRGPKASGTREGAEE